MLKQHCISSDATSLHYITPIQCHVNLLWLQRMQLNIIKHATKGTPMRPPTKYVVSGKFDFSISKLQWLHWGP